MRDEYPKISEKGAELVVVGNGALHFARAFREEWALPFQLFTDPTLKSFEAAGLKRGISTGLRPGVLKNAVRAFKDGFRQGTTQGDPWQQGGVFVLGPGNEERYAYVSREAGDHAPVPDVLRALE